MSYKVKIHRTATKALKNITKGDKSSALEIAGEIRKLEDDPLPVTSIPLQVNSDVRRIRVGHYRILYMVLDYCNTVFIGKISNRNENTYKDIALIVSRAKDYIDKLGLE